MRPQKPPPVTPSRRRRLRGDLFAFGLALILLLVGVVGSSQLFSVDPPDDRPGGAIGVVPPETPRPHLGFAASMGVRFEDCDEPVEVTLVASGTADWWRRYARRLEPSEVLRLAIPGEEPSNLRVWRSYDGTEGYVRPLTQAAERGIPLQSPDPEPLSENGSKLTIPVEDWGKTLHPIVVRFDADWTEGRSWGTCYLRVPALTGSQSVLSAQDARGEATHNEIEIPGEVVVSETGLRAPFEDWLEPPRGLVSIDLGGHSVDSGASAPAPNARIYGLPTWTCGRRPPPRTAILPVPGEAEVDQLLAPSGDSAAVFSEKHIGSWLTAGDCSAVAVIEVAGSSGRRDLLLLLFGAVFSLGVTLVVERVRAVRKRRADGEA